MESVPDLIGLQLRGSEGAALTLPVSRLSKLLDIADNRIDTLLAPDDVIFHFGDSTIAVLTLRRQAEKASEFCVRLLDRLVRTYLIDGEVLEVTANIGIVPGFLLSEGPDEGIKLMELAIADADARA
jgi:GGDEF domain-containing protein